MADNGISKLGSGAVPGMSGARPTAASGARQRAQQVAESTGQGGVQQRQAKNSAPARQMVNVEGKVLDRNAPRGTYLNIVA